MPGVDGPVEADETHIGGKARNMHAKRREQIGDQRGPFNGCRDAGRTVADLPGVDRLALLILRALIGHY